MSSIFEALKSTTIPVHIASGESTETLNIHTEILKRSKFFCACLESGLQESKQQQINLPDDDPEMVKIYLEWLYTGKVECDKKHTEEPLAIFLFANKMCDDVFCNDLMDVIKATFKRQRMYSELHEIGVLYRLGLGKSQLAQLGIKTNVEAFLNDAGVWGTTTKLIDGVESAGSAVSEMMQDYLKELQAQRWSERPTV
jgi:hypothetical protein